MDLLLTDAVSLLLTKAVADLDLGVLGRRDADDLFEGLRHLARVDLHGQADDRSVLDAAHSLDNDVSAVRHLPLPGVKIVNLPSRLKPHADHAHLAFGRAPCLRPLPAFRRLLLTSLQLPRTHCCQHSHQLLRIHPLRLP